MSGGTALGVLGGDGVPQLLRTTDTLPAHHTGTTGGGVGVVVSAA